MGLAVRRKNMDTLQQLWVDTMEELGLLDDIVKSFDSVGE